jgi:hypothetical protein
MVKTYRRQSNKNKTRKRKGGIFGLGHVLCGSMDFTSLKTNIFYYIKKNDLSGLRKYIQCHRMRSNPIGTFHIFGIGKGEKKNINEVLERKKALTHTDMVDDDGRNVLHIALCNGYLEMVNFLLDSFQVPSDDFLNKLNNFGLTPMDDFYTRGLINTNISALDDKPNEGGILFYNCSNVYKAISMASGLKKNTTAGERAPPFKARNASINELKSIENALFAKYSSLNMNIKEGIVKQIETLMKTASPHNMSNFPTFSYK